MDKLRGSQLYKAAYHGNVTEIKKVLVRTDAGDKKSTLSWHHPDGGATALYVACEFGHLEAAGVLLEAGAPPDETRADGVTPLYKACQDGGRLDIAKLLLKHGAKADQVDAAGMTPLWVACHRGKMDLASALLDAKANPSTKAQGCSALEVAQKGGHNDIASLLQAVL